MVSKVNIKARIKRHSRILKEDISNLNPIRNLYHKYNYKIVLFSIIAIIPFYPSFFGMVYGNNTAYEFYRGNIDESSIIGAYNTKKDFNYSNESFLSVEALGSSKRDLSGTNEIIVYKVKTGESIVGIASDFGVSKESIYWANNLKTTDTIHPGNIIKIPPVSGVIYKIKSGDTISQIAKEYNIDIEVIEKQNGIENGLLVKGKEIVLPGAEKKVEVIVPKPVYVNNNTYKATTKTTTASTSYSFAAASTYTTDKGSYILSAKPKYHTFYWGNCTWYVAKYKTVNWGGNANQWLRNAQAKGRATGQVAKLGAIVVFSGSGYNPRYGHVAIVMELQKNHMIISDMNYRRLGEVTYRKISYNQSAIRGYIYGE